MSCKLCNICEQCSNTKFKFCSSCKDKLCTMCLLPSDSCINCFIKEDRKKLRDKERIV